MLGRFLPRLERPAALIEDRNYSRGESRGNMTQKQDDIQLLKAYLKDLEHFYQNILPDLIPSDCENPTPEEILSTVPSKKKQDQWLAEYAKDLLSMAKKCKSPTRANCFKRFSGLLSDSDFPRLNCLLSDIRHLLPV